MDNFQIRTIFLYEFKLGSTATDAANKITRAFGDDLTCPRTAQFWFKRFRDGNFSLENEDRGRPQSRLSDQDLLEAVDQNQRSTCRELASSLNCHHTTVSRHMKQIGKVKKQDEYVPHLLTEHQKVARLQTCMSLIQRHQTLPFLDRIVTCDEKWMMHDNSRRPGSWCDKDAAPLKFPKKDLHQSKVMVTVWWTSRGVVHYSFLPKKQTIDADRYCEQMKEMHAKLAENYPALVNRKGVVLLHDNAKPHTSVKTVHQIKELGYEILPHPPYSPDLSPTDFHLFRDLSNHLQGKMLKSDEQVKNEFVEFIESKDSKYFKRGIEKLVERWQKCVESDGEYF